MVPSNLPDFLASSSPDRNRNRAWFLVETGPEQYSVFRGSRPSANLSFYTAGHGFARVKRRSSLRHRIRSRSKIQSGWPRRRCGFQGSWNLKSRDTRAQTRVSLRNRLSVHLSFYTAGHGFTRVKQRSSLRHRIKFRSSPRLGTGEKGARTRDRMLGTARPREPEETGRNKIEYQLHSNDKRYRQKIFCSRVLLSQTHHRKVSIQRHYYTSPKKNWNSDVL